MNAEVRQFDGQRTLRDELKPGERLVWWGRPSERAFSRLAGAQRRFAEIFMAFAVGWTVLALVFTQAVYWGGVKKFPMAMLFMPAFGLLFVGAANFLFYRLRMRARQTVYGLTDRRAVVVASAYPARKQVVTSYTAERLQHLEIERLPDGSGSVVFERVQDEEIRGRHPELSPRGFIGVADVREVERVVRQFAAEGA